MIGTVGSMPVAVQGVKSRRPRAGPTVEPGRGPCSTPRMRRAAAVGRVLVLALGVAWLPGTAAACPGCLGGARADPAAWAVLGAFLAFPLLVAAVAVAVIVRATRGADHATVQLPGTVTFASASANGAAPARKRAARGSTA